MIVIGYSGYKFTEVLLKMNQKVIFPTNDEIIHIRKYPQKAVDVPTYSKQKVGIIIYSSLLLFMVIVLFVGIVLKKLDWSFFLILFLPFSYSHDLLNLFAVVDDGILLGSRFIAWRKIKSYQFIPIDLNHRYYGYSKEVNNGYELRMKLKGRSINCIVTSDEIKEKVNNVLSEHVSPAETN